MRISDWSSDVCSSDLNSRRPPPRRPRPSRDRPQGALRQPRLHGADRGYGRGGERGIEAAAFRPLPPGQVPEIGRESGRERVCQYEYVTVGAGSLTTTNKINTSRKPKQKKNTQT